MDGNSVAEGPSTVESTRRAWRFYLALLTAEAVILLLWHPGKWHPFRLLIGLAVISAVNELRQFEFGAGRVDAGTSVYALAACLLGPQAIPIFGLIASVQPLRRRTPLGALGDMVSVVAFGLGAGAVFAVARDSGWVQPGQASFALWVGLAALAGACTNFVTVVPYFLWSGQTLLTLVRAMFVPVLAVELSGAAIAGATAHAYFTVGFGAIWALGGVLTIVGVLLAQLSAGERSLVALDESLRERDQLSQQLVSAEERARRQLAADLHDDALQLVATARQEAGGGDRALPRVREHLNAIDESLRALLVRLDAFGTRTTVAAAFEELVATIGGRSGLNIQCELGTGLDDIVDADLVSCARELLLNAEKHAQASKVWITADEHTLTVTDDGLGAEIDVAAALERGHVGLALIAQRAGERDGELTFARPQQGGLRAVVTFGRATQRTVAWPERGSLTASAKPDSRAPRAGGTRGGQ